MPCSDLERRRLKDRDKAWVVADRHLRECGVTPCLRRSQLIVLHYDGDYDVIAGLTGQPVEWVAPKGSL